MATDTRDPLHDALDGLRDDVAGLRLAPADAVRRRGDVRGRNRRVGLTVGSVAAVAAIAITTGQLMQPTGTPRPAPPASASTSASPTSSATPAASAAPRPVVTLEPASPGGGVVPAAYFLPGAAWTGPDLNGGHGIVSVQPRETEGSVTRFACDPDTDIHGKVAFLQVQDAVTENIAGTQKVRLLPSARAAATFATQMEKALTTCQKRLRQQAIRDSGSLPPGETAPTPDATVKDLVPGAVDDARGSVRLYRAVSDYGTGAGSRVTDWVVLAREGSAVTFLSLPQLEGSSVTLGALRRLADEAREQMRWAATR
jgi:hypothetical protein